MGRSEAFELFGEMRSSTKEEQQLYADMLSRLGESTGISIFDEIDGDREYDVDLQARSAGSGDSQKN